jgi:hypothetical protein
MSLKLYYFIYLIFNLAKLVKIIKQVIFENKMEYLQNPFNLKVNQASSNGVIDLLNLFSMYMWYYIVIESLKKVYYIDKYENKYYYSSKYKLDNVTDNITEHIDMYDYIYDLEDFDKISEDSENTRKNLIDLLDINSLDRHYILYYIFKIHGSTDNLDNTYNDYVIRNNFWMIYDDLGMSLDENLPNDYKIVIGNDVFDCNIAHWRFLVWLYKSGIYNYLMINNSIKLEVLSIMNSKRLLKGNIFIKYQLYVIDMDEQINKNNSKILENSIEQEEDMKKDMKEILTLDNVDNSSNSNNSNNENTDDTDFAADYEKENQEELDARDISEDYTEMSEATFMRKLFVAVMKIIYKSTINTYKIIKEEISQIMNTANSL